MAIWRSTLVEELVGGPLDQTGLTASVLHTFCRDAVPENEQLEFKAADAYAVQPKGREIPWRNEQEFAKDVCAFANHVGGVIVIGIREANGGVAGTVDVASRTQPDVEHQRLGQALQQNTSPAVRVNFIAIPVGQEYATAVIVPPSDSAPHGVSVAPKTERRPLCFPIRDGAHTRYMGEPELADRYQRRFLGTAQRQAREQRIVTEGREALDRSSAVWCYLAVVPTVTADATMNREVARQFHTWLLQLDCESPLGSTPAPTGRPIPAPGRLTLTDHPYRDGEDVDEPREGYVELHTDGSFFGAHALFAEGSVGVYDTHLADAIIMLADAGLRWAIDRTGRWGTATVICGLHTGGDIGAQHRLELWRFRRVGMAGVPGRIPASRRVAVPSSVCVADLTACETVQDRMVTAYEAGSSLFQHFGQPELLQLAPNGAINSDTWGDTYSEVQTWAGRRGVPVENSTLRKSHYVP